MTLMGRKYIMDVEGVATWHCGVRWWLEGYVNKQRFHALFLLEGEMKKT